VSELAFRLLSETATLPTRAHEGDAGLDLYAAEEVRVWAGQRASVGTGVAVELPAGTAGLVVPRSGLAARHGIAIVNAPGVIDAGYRGELRVLLLNTDQEEHFDVAVGERVAQLLVVRVELLTPVAAEALAGSERGEGGFGSSGR
jgi:dUTP pyrophosphatase